MNRETLSRISELVGGPGRLAAIMGVSPPTIWRKVTGKSEIRRGDELRVRHGVKELIDELQAALS